MPGQKLSAIEKEKLKVKYKAEFFEKPAAYLKPFVEDYKSRSWFTKWLYTSVHDEAKAAAAEEVLADRRRRGERF